MVNGVTVLAPESDTTGGGFDPEQFAVLFDLEASNFWFRARNELIIWALHRYFPHARRMLELGCGTGFVAAGVEREFPEMTIVASELFSRGAAFARRRLQRADVVQMDGRRLLFSSEFDVAGAFDVIEHVTQDEAVLAELHKALRPGGGLILSVPQHPWLWSELDVYAQHQRRYSRGELSTKLRRAGFEILRCTSFMSLLLPAMFASRLRMAKADQLDPTAEFRLSRAANAALGTIMSAERLLIRTGLSLPFGGSLLAVARRT
jgi:SAM-dependent methyltransferase